jgi:hypothetical protein
LDDSILTLTHAIERDIDLLLVEEFKCNRAFTAWVSGRVWPGTTIAESEIVHSKRRTHTRREIDLCLNLTTDIGGRASLLIENKLEADDQPRQAESYREEAGILITQGRAQCTATMIVCPAAYRAENPGFIAGFDSIITYEEIVSFLQAQADREIHRELAMRLVHRCDLLCQAIKKKRRGYERVPVAAIGTFNRDYVDLCRKRFPGLIPGPAMLRPEVPGESVTMIFAAETLPKATWLPQTRLVHQLREANANINFYTWGDAFEAIALDLRRDLQGTGFTLSATVNRRKGGRSGLMVCVPTPPVDNQRPFADQTGAILQGMGAADRLRGWFLANQSLLRSWSDRIRSVLPAGE